MKQRIDVYLFENGYCESREKARAHVMAGVVFVDNERVDKPGTQIDTAATVELRGGTHDYASRGGLKLEKAIDCFGINLDGLIAADIGASTGGFTDCMLKNGVKKVYAVDVGYGQLAWRLRNDARVVNLERTNARHLTVEQISDRLDFFSVDVSFISLKQVLPPVLALSKDSATAVCLIKPQFEVGKGKVGKNGVVRESELHIEVIENIVDFLREMRCGVLGLSYSPIKGPKGNIEFLAYIGKTDDGDPMPDIAAVVAAAHADL